MKCLCNNEGLFVVKSSISIEMTSIGDEYTIKGNTYQKYSCPNCGRTKLKVLGGYTKVGYLHREVVKK